MENGRDIISLATEYHQALPGRIRGYLNERGIPDHSIDAHLLGWNGSRITIPIPNRKGQISFLKLAKEPEDKTDSPKMLTTRGTRAELYGWETVLDKPQQIVICEGEFDRLVLEAHSLMAVTSTGGAGVFRREWAEYFTPIPEVYVCFDQDAPGRKGAERVGRMIPQARVIELPEEVGPGGDATDFFVRLGRSRADFEKLMERARPVLPEPPLPPANLPVRAIDSTSRDRIERIKRETTIAEIVGRYVKLHESGGRLIGLCPFHSDHNPSFVVFPATGTFHCFGCSQHGDVITFVREVEHLSFREALDLLDRPTTHEPEARQAA